MSHKSRSISGSSCESQRIYNQRRYIHKLEKENQQLKKDCEDLLKMLEREEQNETKNKIYATRI